ncbi:hypothetical protein ACE10Z_23550 [Bradyrhizobium sp. Pha-3]|uniref:hypothetical protein n=1 Tax=Bradyrhizobium sp. Pha-3 TaxID=208375 RepID=UPI0035D4A1D4
MTANARDKRRKRRLASDEAHSWARNMELKNPLGKSVLRAIAFYCNDEGICTAGIDTLAQDCDVTANTVRSRLKFLEDVGAIVRLPCWRDDLGRRNYEGRGKRTTDDIRIMVDADVEMIEARAQGFAVPDHDDAGEISPSRGEGLNPGDANRSPSVALQQPSNCVEGLMSEPEPESFPQPPSRGLSDDEDDREGEAGDAGSVVEEPEHFAFFKANYPGRERWAWQKPLMVFAALSPLDQQRAAAAAPEYAKAIETSRPRQAPFRPDRFLKDRVFDNFPHARLPERPPERAWIVEGSVEWRALEVLAYLLDLSPPRPIRSETGEFGMWRLGAVGADLAALAQFDPDEALEWPVAVPETREFNAWRSRYHGWTGRWPEERIVMRAGQTTTEVNGKPMTYQNRIKGLLTPCRWPPKKDGGLYAEHEKPGNEERA